MTKLPVRPPLPPMLAQIRPDIPVGDGWRYEPKWDGFRAIVFREGDNVRLMSRGDRDLVRFFPELVELIRATPGDPYVADGEIVMVGAEGMDFDLLQLRLHPAASRVAKLSKETPATLVLFDLIARGDRDLRGVPLDERRTELEALVRDLGGDAAARTVRDLKRGPEIVLTPQTDDPDVAREWFEDLEGVGQDGIVAKRADQRYRPGERVMVKVKHQRTAECVVGGYRLERTGNGVGSLLLGLYDDDGVLHYVGHTSGFRSAERRKLLEQLRPLKGEGSFVGGRSPGGASRWSGGRDLEWVTLRPELVCEVTFDRLQSGRFRHAAGFVRWRPDRHPSDCTFDQLRPGRG